MDKIAIVHFQPLEKYPPVMNIINNISELEILIALFIPQTIIEIRIGFQ